MKALGLFLVSLLLLTGSFSFAKGGYSGASAYESTTLNFMPGSHTLSMEEQTRLRTAVNNAREKGTIMRVEVAVWSDKEHPVTGQLPKADRELAQMRIKSIKQALRQDNLHKYAVAYNMTENAHWLGRHMHSTEAELDAVFAKREKGALTREDFEMIKEQGAPSKAVVIFRVGKK